MIDARLTVCRNFRILIILVILISYSSEDVLAESSDSAAWWNSNWKYRIPLLIHDNTEAVVNGHIDFVLEDNILGMYGLSPNGADIRFVYSNSGEFDVLPHWIDDKRITNGAWYSCCDINTYTQYHGPAATYYTNHRPNAIRHAGRYDRTYFVYGDFSRDPAIQYYDHDSKTLSTPVICGRTQIPDDAHGNPSILIDDEGYIYVFFGCHHHPIQIVRSLFPENINSWTTESNISFNATYPQPYMISSDRILLSFRQKKTVPVTAGWVYTYSTDSGQTWSTVKDLIYEPRKYIYAITEVGNEIPTRTFHIAFNPFDYDTNWYSNIYYLYTDDLFQTMKHRSGMSSGSPPCGITGSELVFDSGKNSSHVNDLILDEDNSPYILFNTGPWNKVAMPGDGEWRVARYEENEWKTAHVAPCDHLFDRGCLAFKEDGRMIAYLPVDDDYRDGGEIIEYRSDDKGATWYKELEITGNSEYSHNYVVRVRNPRPDFRALWSYGCSNITYCGWFDRPSEVFLYGDDGFINAGLGRNINISLKVAGLPSVGNIYMYFGNPRAQQQSNMEACLMDEYSSLSESSSDTTIALEWLMDIRQDTLVGHSGIVVDHSGRGNDGYGVFGLESGGSSPGRRHDLSMPGSIVHFSANDYLRLDDWKGSTALDSFSLEMWFRCDTIGSIQPLVNSWNGFSGFILYLDGNGPVFSTGTGGTTGGAFSTPHIIKNMWHHISAVYDGSEMMVYLDGRESTTRYGQMGPVIMNASPLMLGKLGMNYYSGDIDEFRIYSRALSGDEIRSHYMKKINPDFQWTLGDLEMFIPEGEEDDVFFSRAWPNPFNDRVNMEYYVTHDGKISIELFDVAGRRVKTLVSDMPVDEGYHSALWDGRTDSGGKASSGVYFCRVSTKYGQAYTKLVVIR